MSPFGIEKLRGGQPFQHGHRSVAAGTSPEGGLAEMSCRSFFRYLREKSATERKQFAASRKLYNSHFLGIKKEKEAGQVFPPPIYPLSGKTGQLDGGWLTGRVLACL
jgi:hypothetical protein